MEQKFKSTSVDLGEMHISLGEFTSFSEIVCRAGFILEGDGNSYQDKFDNISPQG